MADQFFDSFKAAVEGGDDMPPEPGDAPADATASAGGKGWFKRLRGG